jgi:disulfide bond formation protein DsbB
MIEFCRREIACTLARLAWGLDSYSGGNAKVLAITAARRRGVGLLVVVIMAFCAILAIAPSGANARATAYPPPPPSCTASGSTVPSGTTGTQPCTEPSDATKPPAPSPSPSPSSSHNTDSHLASTGFATGAALFVVVLLVTGGALFVYAGSRRRGA